MAGSAGPAGGVERVRAEVGWRSPGPGACSRRPGPGGRWGGSPRRRPGPGGGWRAGLGMGGGMSAAYSGMPAPGGRVARVAWCVGPAPAWRARRRARPGVCARASGGGGGGARAGHPLRTHIGSTTDRISCKGRRGMGIKGKGVHDEGRKVAQKRVAVRKMRSLMLAPRLNPADPSLTDRQRAQLRAIMQKREAFLARVAVENNEREWDW